MYIYIHRYIDFIYFNFQITLRFKSVNPMNSYSWHHVFIWKLTTALAQSTPPQRLLSHDRGLCSCMNECCSVAGVFFWGSTFSLAFQKQLTFINDTKSWQFSWFFFEKLLFFTRTYGKIGMKASFLTKILMYLHIPVFCRFSSYIAFCGTWVHAMALNNKRGGKRFSNPNSIASSRVVLLNFSSSMGFSLRTFLRKSNNPTIKDTHGRFFFGPLAMASFCMALIAGWDFN